jgi:hypothetical protein
MENGGDLKIQRNDERRATGVEEHEPEAWMDVECVDEVAMDGGGGG